MKKLLSLVLMLAIVLSSVAALAETGDIESATAIPHGKVRNIKIKPAEDNEVEPGYSPTTGRDLVELYAQVEDEDLPFLGMSVTGKYYPIMVQHNGYHSALDFAAPWYGSYADIFYELPKSRAGHTRMCMLFNDYLPPYAGGSRSTRVGYLWIRQEWGCPYFYHGSQEDSWPGKYNTKVGDEISRLKLITDANAGSDTPAEDIMLFNGMDGGNKPFLGGWYRWQNHPDECNSIWDLPYQYTNVLGENRTFKQHAFKFADDLPEGGDPAQTIYVLFVNNKAGTGKMGEGGDDSGVYYFNTMYQYEEDENVYTRWIITDMKDPENNPRPFVEKIVAPGTTPKVVDKNKIVIDDAEGDDITFANVIIQFMEDKFPSGECPYPMIKEGTGNADYFMGGQHFKGVWSRNSLEDRTVFYGEDGQEIELQPGRTMIVMMDYDTTIDKKQIREVRYK